MNIQKLMQEAKKMQDSLAKKTNEFNDKTFNFDYNNLVKIEIKGNLNITKIDINKDLIDPEDKKMLEDVLSEALNKAVLDVSKQKEDITKSIMPNMPNF